MNKLFLGTFTYSLDDKKRVRIPNRFKELLGKEVVITLVDNGEISLSSKKYFEEYIDKMYSANSEDKNKQAKVIRHLTAFSEEINIDSNGRLLIPDSFINHGSIDKNVVIMGNGKKAIILSEENYLKYNENSKGSNIIGEALNNFKDDLFM